jgi:PIN domain nuclease of toxin-antitoxin system
LKLLLDTHVLLWVMQDAPALGRAARRVLSEAEEIHVSSVSLWEAAIKCAVGKLKLDLDALDLRLGQVGFMPLAVSWAHARQLRQLPLLHADPFDRMLVSQAISEPLHLLTHDAALKPYSDLVIVI